MKIKEKKKQNPKENGRFPWPFLLVSMLIGFAMYVGTAGHGYVLDDISAITENTLVKQGSKAIFSTEKNIWNTDYRYGYWNEPGSLYRPLALSLFAWEWEQWENDPVPAHWINIFLFTAICGLLFYWIHLLFGRRDPWLPLLISVAFAVHPIHTEVTANIKSADELLAVFFSLIMFVAFQRNGKRWFSPWMLLGVGSYFLALTSKESVVTLVPVVPLTLWFFDQQEVKTAIRPALWMLVPIGLYFMLRTSVLGALAGKETFQMIDNMLAELHGAERIATAIKISGLYLWKLIVPHPLSHDYSYNEIKVIGLGSIYFWLSLLAMTALGWYAVRQWKSKSVLAYAIVFYALTFSLFSNLVLTIGTHFGERLLFLPSIALAIAIGWLIWKWGTLKSTQFSLKNSIIPLAVFSVIMLVYGMKTFNRNADRKSEIDLYEADVKNAPESTRTHYRLGMAYMKEKAILMTDQKEKNMWLRKALPELMRSVEIYPEYADAQGELGLAYQRLGMRDLAVEHYKIALKYNPTHHTTLNNLGTVYFEQGKFDRAIASFQRALEKNPRYKDAAGNLASCYGTIGQYDEAIKWFKRAIELDPRNASYYYFIGLTYENKGDLVAAEEWRQKAYRIDPGLQPKNERP